MSLHAVVSGWLLGPASGANRRLLALLEHTTPLLAADERITVLHARPFEPPAIARVVWRAVDVPAGPAWRRALAERRVLPALLRELRATVLDHGFLPLPTVPVPGCLTVHDLRGPFGLTRWPRWLARAVLRRACRRAAAVIVPSEWTAAQVRSLAPGVSPIVAHNAIGALQAPSDASSAPPPPANGYVLHVGHVEARKNLRVVVDALALLAPPRPELWLAGRDAGALPALLARARVANVTVRAFGAVDEPTLAALYRSAHAVVLPSLHEGFGLPALEGLAHGRPVLVAANTALPEVTGTHGVVLSPHDARAWADAIATPPIADAAARARHVAAFTWRATAERVLATWRRVSIPR